MTVKQARTLRLNPITYACTLSFRHTQDEQNSSDTVHCSRTPVSTSIPCDRGSLIYAGRSWSSRTGEMCGERNWGKPRVKVRAKQSVRREKQHNLILVPRVKVSEPGGAGAQLVELQGG